jgi:hypothetical protein
LRWSASTTDVTASSRRRFNRATGGIGGTEKGMYRAQTSLIIAGALLVLVGALEAVRRISELSD